MHHLFSVNCYYLQGFTKTDFTSHELTIIDNGVTNVYNYITASRGSGIYLELTRKLQFYPRKIRRKSEN
jgi:hypothetical protein